MFKTLLFVYKPLRQLLTPQLYPVALVVQGYITGGCIFGKFAAAEPVKRKPQKPWTALSAAIDNLDSLFRKIGSDIMSPVGRL